MARDAVRQRTEAPAKAWVLRGLALLVVALALVRGGGGEQDPLQAWVDQIEHRRLVEAAAGPVGRLLSAAGVDGEEVVRLLEAAPALVPGDEPPPEGSRAVIDYAGSEPVQALLLWRGEGRWSWTRSVDDERGWQAEFEAFDEPFRRRTVPVVLSGEVGRDLEAAGLPAALAFELADALRWQVDFFRELSVGDRFELRVAEEAVGGGEFEFERLLAFRYQPARGRAWEGFNVGGVFADASGRLFSRMFLRSPLPVSRVTSGFERARVHPIHGEVRPHLAVDYAAPLGTPVVATADGVVRFVGPAGAAGLKVELDHAGGWATQYLHLADIALALSDGKPVRQGDVVGFVGQSGDATGPHLDYRISRFGAPVNALALDPGTELGPQVSEAQGAVLLKLFEELGYGSPVG